MRFDTPQVRLLRNKDGKNNWTFDKQEQPSPWQLELQSVVFSKGTVTLDDAVTHTAMRADVDTIADDARYGIAWKLSGKYRGENIQGGGKAGGVLSLQQQGTPFPIQADMRASGSSVAIEGTLTRPADLAALDVRLKISGPSMARLYPLTGVLLPETPHFSTEGHLTGTLAPARRRMGLRPVQRQGGVQRHQRQAGLFRQHAAQAPDGRSALAPAAIFRPWPAGGRRFQRQQEGTGRAVDAAGRPRAAGGNLQDGALDQPGRRRALHGR